MRKEWILILLIVLFIFISGCVTPNKSVSEEEIFSNVETMSAEELDLVLADNGAFVGQAITAYGPEKATLISETRNNLQETDWMESQKENILQCNKACKKLSKNNQKRCAVNCLEQAKATAASKSTVSSTSTVATCNLFDENFEDGETAIGKGDNWKIIVDGSGNQILDCPGAVIGGIENDWAFFGNVDWNNYVSKISFKLLTEEGFRFIFFNTPERSYRVLITPTDVTLIKFIGETRSELMVQNYPFTLNTWYQLKVQNIGGNIAVSINDVNVLNYFDASTFNSGMIQLETIGDAHIQIDDIQIIGDCPIIPGSVSSCTDNIWNGEEQGIDCGPVCGEDCCKNSHHDKNLGECDIDRGGSCQYGCIWEKTNGPQGGKTLIIAVDQIDSNVLYTGVYPITDNALFPYDGGVYKSFDGGLTWIDKSKGLDNKEIWSVKIDPSNHNIIYAGSNDGDIYKSEDAGENWRKVKDKGQPFETIFSLEIDQTDHNIVLAGSRYGIIYRTVDGGNTWTTINNANGLDTDGVISSIHISPHNHNLVLATSGFMDVWDLDSRHGVFKSEDNGQTWRPLTNGLGGNVNFGDTAFHPTDSNVIYAVNGLISEDNAGLFRSDNLGETWSNVYPGVRLSSIEINPLNPNIIYLGGESMEVLKSTDGGNNWDYITSGVLGPDNGGSFITGLTLDTQDPDRIFIASYAAGNYRSLDGGANWEEINDQIRASYTKALATDYSSSLGVYASSFTNGLHLINGGLDWERIRNVGSGINGFARLITSRSDPNLMYGIGDFILSSDKTITEEFRVSYDQGRNWQIITLPLKESTLISVVRDPTRSKVMSQGIDVFSPGETQIKSSNAHVFSAVIDPTNSNIAYAGTIDGGIFKTIDKGVTWVQKNNGLGVNKNIRSININPSTGRVYAGAVGDDAELFYSDDQGENWQKLNDDLTFTTIWGHSQLQIDPTDKNTVYAGTWGGGTFKTTNGGTSWNRLQTNEPSALFSPTCLAIAPSNPKILYACDRTRAVVWRHDNGGVDDGINTWKEYSNLGSDYLLTSAIAVDKDNPNRIYVAAFKPPVAHEGGLFVLERGRVDETINLGTALPRSVLDIEIDPNNKQTIYVTTHVYGVFKSTDGGTNWQRLDGKNGLPRIGFYDLDVDKTDSKIIYATSLCGQLPDYLMPAQLIPKVLTKVGVIQNLDPKGKCGVYRSVDGGMRWKLILSTISEARGIEVDSNNPKTLYVADMMGGVWVSNDRGTTWRQENNGLGSLSMTSVKVKDNYIYASTQGSGVYSGVINSDGTITWDKTRSNKPKVNVYNLQIEVDPTREKRIYVSGFPGGLLRSDDGGFHWNDKNFLTPTPLIDDPNRKAYYTFALDPTNSNNIVLCLFGKGCYVSYDGMDYDAPFNTGLEVKQVYSVAFDASGQYIYAGTNGGSVFRARLR